MSALPTPLAALQQLENISIAAPPAVMQDIVPLLATSALTQLQLGPSRDTSSLFIAADPPWVDFFHSLRPCKLRALELDICGAALTGHGLASLSTLTQLTALSIHGWSCLNSPEEAQALAAMAQLQQLCLEHDINTDDDFQVSRECVGSLHALSALT